MDAFILTDFSESAASQHTKALHITKIIKGIASNSSFKLLLVCAVGFVAWFSWKPSLYDQYKLSNAVIVSQLSSSSNAEFKTAAAYLENGDFYSARLILSKYYLKDMDNTSLAKQYASILIASDCFETSKQVLYPVFANADKKNKAEAAYLLGLTFLKEGRYLTSQQWLVKVTNGSANYRQAQDLILKLEKFKTL